MSQDKNKTRPSPVRRIGVHPGGPNLTYHLCDDGNVWFCDYRPVTNEGPLEQFMEKVRQNKYRINLDS